MFAFENHRREGKASLLSKSFTFSPFMIFTTGVTSELFERGWLLPLRVVTLGLLLSSSFFDSEKSFGFDFELYTNIKKYMN